MTWKAYAVVSGAGLLATYLASAPPTLAPGQNSGRSRPDARQAATPTDLQAEALKLQTRVKQSSGYADPPRDPFRFGEHAAPSRRVHRAEPTVPAAPLPQTAPEPPPIRLSGIATRIADGERQRTAILITPEGPVEAREGDAVTSDYHVTRIQDDAVELTGPNGIIRRLVLRP